MNTAEKNKATRSRKPVAKPAEKKAPATPGLAALPAKDLRAKLLAVPTIADRAWAPARGVPARNEGESRTAYIERVLPA